jgi:hypothetical protein
VLPGRFAATARNGSVHNHTDNLGLPSFESAINPFWVADIKVNRRMTLYTEIVPLIPEANLRFAKPVYRGKGLSGHFGIQPQTVLQLAGKLYPPFLQGRQAPSQAQTTIENDATQTFRRGAPDH